MSLQSLPQGRFNIFGLIFLVLLLHGCVSVSKDHYYRLTNESSYSNVTPVCSELRENLSQPITVGSYQIALGQFPSPVFFGPILPIIPIQLSGRTTEVILQFAETNSQILPEQWRLRTSPSSAPVEGKIRRYGIYSYLAFTIPDMPFPKEIYVDYLDPKKKIETHLHFSQREDWNVSFFIGQEPGPWFPRCKVQAENEAFK